jgi:lysozyme
LKAGLQVGCYHFEHPNNKPEEDAQNFIEAILAFKYTLLPVLDLEYSPEGISDEELYNWARAFVNTVKSKTGYDVVLYTGLWFLNKYPELKKLNDLPLWITAYRDQAPTVSGWNQWIMWQYTDKEPVPGVSGNCDANYLKDLNAILVEKPKPVTAPKAPSNPAFKRILKLTTPPMQGEDVRLLQNRLNIKEMASLDL